MIFVTGATGLLGNCVVRDLLHRGESVRVLCRRGTHREPLEGLAVEIVEGDLDDAEILVRAAEGCRAVVHCAALIHLGWSRLEESRRVNVEGTRRVVEACLTNGCRLIHIASVDTLQAAKSIQSPIDESEQDGVPKIPCDYVVSKREADEVVRQAISTQHLDAVIVHPALMLGPYDWKPSSGRLILGVARAPLAFAPGGGCSLCDARDVASAVVNAIDHGRSGQSYILAGENMTYRDLWSRILQTAGRPNRVFSPVRVMRWYGKTNDRLVRALSIPEGEINGASIAMGQLFHYYSSNKAREELGYTVRLASQTLQDAWQWHADRAK